MATSLTSFVGETEMPGGALSEGLGLRRTGYSRRSWPSRSALKPWRTGEPDVVHMSEEIAWAIFPARRRRPGARRGGRVTVTTDYSSPSGVPVVPAAVVLAFVNDLNAIE